MIKKYSINWFAQKFNSAGALGLLNWMPDKLYIQILFRLRMGSRLDLKHPRTFNQKLQWLKLYDRKPIYATMVDKYEVKKFVAERIGEEYIIPTLGVWDKFEDIDFAMLPRQFVLKCTHDSGGLVICRDKSQLDMMMAKEKIEHSLKANYYFGGREWPYKNVKPRIIAEQYMQDGVPPDLPVYRFFCFNGEPKIIQVIQNESIDYFDIQWNLRSLKGGNLNSKIPLKKPENFDRMLELVRRLYRDKKSFLCADLYDEINDKIYFTEYTFFSDVEMENFDPQKWDEILETRKDLAERSKKGYLILSEDRIVFEKEKVKSLTDYKFYCFNGKPEYLYVSTGLENHATASISFLTLDWEFAPFGRSDYKPFTELPEKPSLFEKMKVLATKLAEGHKFLRVDLYQINGRIYFSELTFSPCCGMMMFDPVEWDQKLGDLIQLS